MNLYQKSIILSIVVIILVSFMPQLLAGKLANRLTRKLKKKYNIFFRIENMQLRGIKKFTFDSLYIKTGKYKILLKNGSIIIKLSAFLYKKSFYEIVENFALQEVFLLHVSQKTKKDKQLTPKDMDEFSFEKRYYPFFRKSIEKFWQLSFRGSIQRLVIISSFHNRKISLFFKDFDMAENTLKGYVEIDIEDYWVKTPFKLNKESQEYVIEINSENLGHEIVCAKNNHLFSFSGYKMTYKETDNSNYIFSGEVSDIFLSSQNVSSTTVLIKKLEFDQLIRFTKNEFRILKESSLNFDGISSFMEFHHCCSESDLLRMSVIFFLDGQDFLQNFPFLSVQNLRSLGVSGDMALKLDYMTSLADFSSYYFNSQVLQNTLEIKKSKEFDLSYLSADFVHNVNSLSGILRSINISKANKDFLSINEIPSYLRNVIETAEDPNFYNHKGIDSFFVGVALARNIINKNFIKGASTITMQVAKNLFLSQTKSLARKFEEVVLAWLMENCFNMSKNRIVEIYLNIIEFGENIFGLSEAAQYYFEKKVSELDITESLVLSYVIPRPRYFLEAVLMKSPKLILNLTRHIDFYSRDLLGRRLIDKELYNEIKYEIQFKPSIGTLVLK